jgi:hypothetical protein
MFQSEPLEASEPEPRDLAMEAFNADPAFASFNCIPDTPAQSAAEPEPTPSPRRRHFKSIT